MDVNWGIKYGNGIVINNHAKHKVRRDPEF